MKLTKKYGCYEYKPGCWMVYFNHDGKQVHLTKFRWCPDTLKSKEDCDMVVADLIRRGYDPEDYDMKDKAFEFDRMARTWVELTKKDTERMRERGRFVEKIFIPYFGKKDARDISTLDIDQFTASLQAKGYQPLYIRNIRVDLKAFFTFNKKVIPDPPEFRKIEAQEKVIKWLSPNEQDKVFEFIPKKHLPIFTFLRAYGCRLNEACGLLWDNVFMDKGFLSLSSVVNRDRQLKPFTKKKQLKIRPIIWEISWVFGERKDSPYVFLFQDKPYSSSTLYSVWRAANEKANEKYGVPVVNVYCGMRHSFATQKLNMGFDLYEVSKALGHSSVEMTKRYAQYTMDHLRGVYSSDIGGKSSNLLDYKGVSQGGQFQQNCLYFYISQSD